MSANLVSIFTAVAVSTFSAIGTVSIVYCVEKISARRAALKKEMN